MNDFTRDAGALRHRLTELLAERSRAGDFSGTVLLQHGDAPLFQGAYGYANRPWRVENAVDTRFRIASISKMFTAVAVLQLVDAGELSLDTEVAPCLDLEETAIPPEATVYHMLTMTSGIADWFEESGNWEEDWAELCRDHPIYLFRENEDYLPLFVDEPPMFPVGERFQYNGAGYILLGLMIERLADERYAEYVRHNIFARAGMARSGFVALDDVDREVAEGYIPITDADDHIVDWRKNIYSTTPEAAADGGATSTAGDLVRFIDALRSGRLLSQRLTKAMLSPHVRQREDRPRGYVWEYGFGNAFIRGEDGRIVRWGHTGEEDGVSCRLYHYPGIDVDVVILGNQSWCAGRLGWEIHDLLKAWMP